jgi:hypothetical protein
VWVASQLPSQGTDEVGFGLDGGDINATVFERIDERSHNLGAVDRRAGRAANRHGHLIEEPDLTIEQHDVDFRPVFLVGSRTPPRSLRVRRDVAFGHAPSTSLNHRAIIRRLC